MSEDGRKVHEQYEALPYPAVDPEDERKRLVRTWLDDLPMLNHYGFGGRQTFKAGFRALVAGAGTGDATIFLAQQLRDTDAEIVHLDFSAASTAIARRRAEIRGLRNIRWIEASLLDLPRLGLGTFDYVNCVGVLHHLPEPERGLEALLGARKPEGVLGIMVYARYGRTGVYQMQDLLRRMGAPALAHRDAIRLAREVLGCLPATSWFRHNEHTVADHIKGGDPGLYDLLLHACDRAYTVEEVYAWFEDRHGLHVELTDVMRGRAAYLPRFVVGPKEPSFLESLSGLPERAQHAIGELLRGDVTMHTFYASAHAGTVAPYGRADYVPFLFHDPVTGPELAALVRRHGGKPFVIAHQHSRVAVPVDPGRYGAAILAHLDGKRTFGEIFSRGRGEPELRGADVAEADLFDDFRKLYDVLRAIDVLLLRHRDAG